MGAFVSAGVGHKDFDAYRDRLRTTMVLWRLQGLAEDGKYGFCGHKGPECQCVSYALKCSPACKNQ